MKAYNGYKAEKYTGRPQLPPGAYVCKIYKVEYREEANYKALILQFDIEEGEYNGFFYRDYQAQQPKDGKEKYWSGNIWQFLPKDDGSEADEMTKARVNNMFWAFETSNPGFVWNWNEQELKGKEIGILFRKEEFEFKDGSGKTGWSTKAFSFTDVESVRKGDIETPKGKPLNKKSGGGDNPNDLNHVPDYTGDDLEDEGLPFR